MNQILFGYLYHTNIDYPATTKPSQPTITQTFTATSTVVETIKQLSKDLQFFMPLLLSDDYQNVTFNDIQQLTLLIGGSVPLDPDLIHDGFALLNDNNTNHQIQQLLQSETSIHLV
jgi:hypothetical protein